MKFLKELLLAHFLLPLFTYAQDNFQPGMVITLNGDTAHGFINFKAWDCGKRGIFVKVLAVLGAIAITIEIVNEFSHAVHT